MRHQPFGIGAVAGVAAAQMVVDAAERHAAQQQVERLPERRGAAACRLLREEAEDRGVGEFRCPPQPAALEIHQRQQALPDPVQRLRRDPLPWLRGRHGAERAGQRLGILQHRLVALAIGARHRLQPLAERGHAPARLRREIGAAPERLAGGGEEHGQRPAALLAHGLQRRHVDVIDVRPLLAVDLDVDEQAVHLRRRRRVLEGFMRHHVAPVAGGVADREQDRTVERHRLGQRRRAPRPPVDGIGGVLQKIRRFLPPEQVRGRQGRRGDWRLGHLAPRASGETGGTGGQRLRPVPRDPVPR